MATERDSQATQIQQTSRWATQHGAAGSSALVLIALLALATSSVIGSGCAGTHTVGGSSLSEGAREAAKAPSDKKKLLARGERVVDVIDVVVEVIEVDSETAVVEYDDCCIDAVVDPEVDLATDFAATVDPAERLSEFDGIGFSIGGTLFGGHDLVAARSYTFRLAGNPGEASDRLRWEADLSIAPIEFRRQLALSFDGGLELGLAGTARYHLTPVGSPIGLHAIGGLRAGLMRWGYRSPVWMDDADGDAQPVTSDLIVTWTPYAGLGLGFLQTRHLTLGADLLAGVTFFDGHTFEGLENDLLDPTFNTQLRISVTTRF